MASTSRIVAPVRIGIDCRSLVNGPPGIATYVKNLLARIPRLDRLHASFPQNNFLWNHLRALPSQRIRGWTLYHAPAYTAPILNLCPLILSVHDISYLVKPDWYPHSLTPLRKIYYEDSLKRADRIIVPSEFSRGEVLRFFPALGSRVRRVYMGVSDFFQRDETLAARVREKRELPEKFLLHVGDIHVRRNLDSLIKAASQLGLPVVLVGRVLRGGEPFQDWPQRYAGISDRELKGFYSAATAFVYPSLYEGFGLPLLEAMACGLPVVASNRSCLPEICEGAAVLVDPDLDGLTEGIRTVLRDPERYRELGIQRAQQFGWDRTAKQTQGIYDELT